MSVSLIHGDALETLFRQPSGSAKLVLTSPPYGIGKEYEKARTLADYLAWIEPIAQQCVRVLSDGGSLCWQVGNWVRDGEVIPLDCPMWRVFTDLGLTTRNRIVWHFPHGLHCKNRFSGRHETVLWMTKGDDYTFNLDEVRVPQKWPQKRYFKGPRAGQLSCNPKGCNPADVWSITNVKHNHPEKTDHPCQFPEELCRRLILALTDVGDTVLDPFAGSGTVGVVAARYDRRALLVDSKETYVQIMRERLTCSQAE